MEDHPQLNVGELRRQLRIKKGESENACLKVSVEEVRKNETKETLRADERQGEASSELLEKFLLTWNTTFIHQRSRPFLEEYIKWMNVFHSSVNSWMVTVDNKQLGSEAHVSRVKMKAGNRRNAHCQTKVNENWGGDAVVKLIKRDGSDGPTMSFFAFIYVLRIHFHLLLARFQQLKPQPNQIKLRNTYGISGRDERRLDAFWTARAARISNPTALFTLNYNLCFIELKWSATE